MSLAEDVRGIEVRILARLGEARNFYLHTRQAWRVVQQLAFEGHSVGIVDTTSGLEVRATDLEPLAQRYVTVHLAESAFRSLSGFLEDWICGLARLWLTAYPKQISAAYNEVVNRNRAQRREEIQISLSDILASPDIASVIGEVVERVIRDLAYRRPDQWFQFIDNRVSLGCPNEAQRIALCEMKAARDALEHNRGVVGQDYLEKAGAAARFVAGTTVEIDEPYLLGCFNLLHDVIAAMASAAIRRAASLGAESA